MAGQSQSQRSLHATAFNPHWVGYRQVPLPLAGVRSNADQLGAGRLDIGDDKLQTFSTARGRGVTLPPTMIDHVRADVRR